MSKVKQVKTLTHSEVQKKIIQQPLKLRPKEELLGPFNRYRDENFAIYTQKREQFLEASKKYHRLNQETLVSHKKRLMEDYRNMLDCEFLKEENEKECNMESETGTVMRTRSVRPLNKLNTYPNTPCTMEPWFVRYLKLNKFIWAGRKIILKNRLLRVLEKLKTVTEEDIKQLEKRKTLHVNVSYAEIFEKFM